MIENGKKRGVFYVVRQPDRKNLVIKPLFGRRAVRRCSSARCVDGNVKRFDADFVQHRPEQSCFVLAVSIDRKSTRLNSSHQIISYAVFCLKKKKKRT